MAQIFKSSANTWVRTVLIGLPLLALVFICAGNALTWSGYRTDIGKPPDQAVPFSHQHHVGEVGLDCRYCHAAVESSSFADLPPTHTCMTCHSQILSQAPMLAPVRESFRTGEPIHWTRVNDLPDFVYFDHSIHVAKGVGCVECHGRVDEMPLTWKSHSLYMKWCLDCHANPAPRLRPREAVFEMDWRPAGDPLHQGLELMKRYHIPSAHALTDCIVCHR